MDILKWTALIAVAVIALYAGLTAFGAWRWNEATRGLVARLDASRVAGDAARYDAAEIADLPAPVRRYFQLALTDGQPIIRSVDVKHSGTFNMSMNIARWLPFTSQQLVSTNRPGFIWNARIMMFPGVPVRVHDAYITGEGLLRPSILGLFALTDVQGGGDIAKGELMRYFAEAVWYPTALLPSQGVSWQAVDDTSANATLTDGPIRLTMLFRFGDDGLVSSIYANARGQMVGATTVMMPWEGRMSDYRKQDGMTVPFTSEVGYITPQGEKPYFRGTITQLTYAFAQ